MLCGLLALLAADNLVLVLDTLSEVWLRTLDVADLRSELADTLLVSSLDGDGVLHDGNGKALRNGKRYRVGEAYVEHELVAAKLNLVSHTIELEDLLPWSFDTRNHGAHMSSVGAGESAREAAVASRSHDNTLRSDLDGYCRMNLAREGLLSSFYGKDAAGGINGDLRWDSDWLLC